MTSQYAPASAVGTPPPRMRSPYDNFEVPFSPVSTAGSQLEDAIEGIRRSLNQPRTPLFEAFFAVTNVDVVQNRLRATILRRSGFAIDRQSDTDLLVIMRKVFGENADTTADVPGEVDRLNDKVLYIIVPMVASGLTGYLNYVRDASSIPQPLTRGESTSVKGTKTFEMFRGL